MRDNAVSSNQMSDEPSLPSLRLPRSLPSLPCYPSLAHVPTIADYHSLALRYVFRRYEVARWSYSLLKGILLHAKLHPIL